MRVLPIQQLVRQPIFLFFAIATVLGLIGIWVDRPKHATLRVSTPPPNTQRQQQLSTETNNNSSSSSGSSAVSGEPPAEAKQQQQLQEQQQQLQQAAGLVPNPVLPHLPDPFMLPWEGKWYAFGSVGNGSGGPGTDGYQIGLRVWVGSTDMRQWEDGGLALTPPPDGSMGVEDFWAPEVMARNDTIYMTYTAGKRLYIARATAPTGPFEKHAGPLRDEWMIDSHFFQDDDGQMYLYYGYAGGIGVSTLSDDLLSMGNTTHCFSFQDAPEPWVEVVNEGPYVLKHNGTYYMVYSGNPTGIRYGVGFATSTSPLGPWTKSRHNPILWGVRTHPAQTRGFGGTGHCSFIRTGQGQDRLVMLFHMAMTDTFERPMCASPASFVPDPGHPDRLEVEPLRLAEVQVLV